MEDIGMETKVEAEASGGWSWENGSGKVIVEGKFPTSRTKVGF